jgi:ABC-type transporter Mla subunit MlaD
MPDTRTYRRIVITAVAVLVAVAIFAIIARQTFLRYEFDLVTFVGDSAGVTPSSPVLLNGIGIGHVRLVSLSGSKDPLRTVRIDMRFNRRYLKEIPNDSTIAIAATNLLGDKNVTISRGNESRHIEPGSEIRSTETQDISSVLQRGAAPLQQINDVFDRIDRILKYAEGSQGTVGLLVNDRTFQRRIEGITDGVHQIESDLKTGRGAILHTGDLSRDLDKPRARLNEMMADLDHGKGTLGRLMHDPNDPALTAQASATVTEAKRLFDDALADKRPAELMKQVQATSDRFGVLRDRIDSGQGTAGQLLANPQLRDSVGRVQAELNSLMADFEKHPARFVKLSFGLF